MTPPAPAYRKKTNMTNSSKSTDESTEVNNKCCLAIVILIAVTIILLYPLALLLTHPPSPFVYITNASLNQFSLIANGNTLLYDLDLSITAVNPNKNYVINYDDVRVTAFWSPMAALSHSDSSYVGNQEILEKRRFAIKYWDSFYQGKLANTTLPALSFKGQQIIMSVGVNHVSVVKHLSNPNPNASTDDIGFYDIVVEVYFRNRFKKSSPAPYQFKGNWVRTWKQESTFVCDLKVPLIGSGGTQSDNTSSTTSATFETTQCVRAHSD